MKKTLVSLTERQLKLLDRLAEKDKSINRSEHIRKAIDEYLDKTLLKDGVIISAISCYKDMLWNTMKRYAMPPEDVEKEYLDVCYILDNFINTKEEIKEQIFEKADKNTPKNADGIIVIPKDDEWLDDDFDDFFDLVNEDFKNNDKKG